MTIACFLYYFGNFISSIFRMSQHLFHHVLFTHIMALAIFIHLVYISFKELLSQNMLSLHRLQTPMPLNSGLNF